MWRCWNLYDYCPKCNTIIKFLWLRFKLTLSPKYFGVGPRTNVGFACRWTRYWVNACNSGCTVGGSTRTSVKCMVYIDHIKQHLLEISRSRKCKAVSNTKKYLDYLLPYSSQWLDILDILFAKVELYKELSTYLWVFCWNFFRIKIQHFESKMLKRWGLSSSGRLIDWLVDIHFLE